MRLSFFDGGMAPSTLCDEANAIVALAFRNTQLVPGPVSTPPMPWMDNGSYFAFRGLNQEVERLSAALARLEPQLRDAGEGVLAG